MVNQKNRGLQRSRSLLLHSIVLCFLSLPVQAQSNSWKLVCFGQTALKESLSKVSNPQQFLRNDRVLKSGRCDFARIPPGSTARFAGFHESPQGYIFPTFQVRYATTGQRMYAADGIFISSAWRISQRGLECRNSRFGDTCLVPRTCQALDGFVTSGRVPGYIAVPRSCQVFRTQ